MTLVSRDQMPARTPYEAELRERLQQAQQLTAAYEQLAVAQDYVVQAAQAIRDALPAPGASLGRPIANLVEALKALERERGRIVLDTMPPEIRAALTGPSAFEEALKAQDGPLFPGLTENREATPASLDLDGFARDLTLAGSLEVEMLAGHGWPAAWADFTGISDHEVVWPVQPKGQPVPGGNPVAAFASNEEQRLYWRLRNAAPVLLAVARAAVALCETTGAAHARWCRKSTSDTYDTTECTCTATALNRKLDALRGALVGD